MNSVQKVEYKPLPIATFFKQPEDVAMQRLRKLATMDNMCLYEVGCYLCRVLRQGLWKYPRNCLNVQNEGYSTYGNWVYGELGFTSRKGRYLAAIASRIEELSLDGDEVSMLVDRGWPRTYQLVQAPTKEDFEEWVRLTMGMTERETRQWVREQLSKNKEEEPKSEGKEDDLSPAIKVTAKFSQKANYQIFRIALAKMEKQFGNRTMEEALACLAGHYVGSSLSGQNGEELPCQLDLLLRVLEKSYGVTLAVVTQISSQG